MSVPILALLCLVEALVAASTTTLPRAAWKQSRFLGPVRASLERAGSTGGGTVYGASLRGVSSASYAAFKGDGSTTVFDTAIPYAALANNNWLVRVDRSGRSGTAAVTAGGKTVTGTSTAFDTELAVGDEIQVNGEQRVVVAVASSTSLTVDLAFAASASGATVLLLDGLLVPATDFTVSSNGGMARITAGAAGKVPAGAKIEVHAVVPVAVFAYATATTQFKKVELPGGYDVYWYASDATASPSATNVYLEAVGG